MHYDVELDGRGLRCPLPLLRTKDLLRKLTPGDVLRVVADDPQAPRDFEVFANRGGHDLVAQAHEGGVFIFYIRRGSLQQSAADGQGINVSVTNWT